ncbi:MAG: PadR family transcriptional regulator [Actinobacteria bacterium]|nr:PadR family transcriptional regulator [Actinomycetota bacterium]
MSEFTPPPSGRGRGGFGGGFGGGFSRERRGSNRVRRGDVQTAVLALLAEADMHGYQIIQELAERSGGVWRPGAGSIYPTLRQLQEQGLIRSREEGSKRVFSITDLGRRSAPSGAEREPWQQWADADGSRVQLRRATESLLSAIAQVDAAGTDAQAVRAVEILGAARKSLYLLLAEEES